MSKLASIFGDHVWAMSREHRDNFEARAESVMTLFKAGMSPAEKAKEAYNGGSTVAPEIVGDTATLELIGEVCARAPWYAKAYLGVIDPLEFAAAVDELTANVGIKTIKIEADTCGGTVQGTQEINAAIRRARAAGKYVETRVVGNLLSAGYWALCDSDKIIAGPTSLIGSCGVCVVLSSAERMRVAAGIDTELIASGPSKGLGNDGKISEALKAEVKGMVDGMAAIFFLAIATGRSLSGPALDAVTTGEVWLSSQAKTLGLIDEIDTPADEAEVADGNAEAPAPVPPALDGEGDGGPEAKSIQPLAAASTEKESTMDANLQAALTALSDAHPTLSAALIKEAFKPQATAEKLNDLVTKSVTAAKDAEISDLKAKLATAEAKATTEAGAKSAAEENLAKIKAHGTNHEDPGNGDQPPVAVAPMGIAEFSKLDLKAKSVFIKAGGKLLPKV
jgi:ClpP class serine protease